MSASQNAHQKRNKDTPNANPKPLNASGKDRVVESQLALTQHVPERPKIGAALDAAPITVTEYLCHWGRRRWGARARQLPA